MYFDIHEFFFLKKIQLHTFQSHLGSLHVKCQEVDPEVDLWSNEVDPKSDYHKTHVF